MRLFLILFIVISFIVIGLIVINPLRNFLKWMNFSDQFISKYSAYVYSIVALGPFLGTLWFILDITQ